MLRSSLQYISAQTKMSCKNLTYTVWVQSKQLLGLAARIRTGQQINRTYTAHPKRRKNLPTDKNASIQTTDNNKNANMYMSEGIVQRDDSPKSDEMLSDKEVFEDRRNNLPIEIENRELHRPWEDELEKWQKLKKRNMVMKMLTDDDTFLPAEIAHKNPLYVQRRNEEMDIEEKGKLKAYQRRRRLKQLMMMLAEFDHIKTEDGLAVVENTKFDSELDDIDINNIDLDNLEEELEKNTELVESSERERSEKVAVPVLPNFVAVYGESKILQQLVGVGIDISTFQRAGLANKALNLCWEEDVMPFLMELKGKTTIFIPRPFTFEVDDAFCN